MLTSNVPQPSIVLSSNASTNTTPSVLTQQILQANVELVDLRIGLYLLGQEGRLLLAQYLKIKSQQQMSDRLA